MKVVSLEIPDVKLLKPTKFVDDRGFFSESYNLIAFRDVGIDLAFVQDNHVFSASKWTVRGLHFQTPPYAQDKLLRVLRGSVLDVAVDIRRGSPTYGQHVSVTLSAETWTQILVPIGFAHAYLTLEPNTEVIYKVTNHYSPKHDNGLLWNDPELAINWPISEDEAILSVKDRAQPLFKDFDSPFHYGKINSNGKSIMTKDPAYEYEERSRL